MIGLKKMAKKILIVDDETDIRELVKTVLGTAGFKVDGASSGPDALGKLKKKANYSLVLIDFFMPKMSGRELLETIRKDKKLKKLKCAFLTVATFSKKGQAEIKKLGSLDYIRKPFDNEDLVRRVKKLTK